MLFFQFILSGLGLDAALFFSNVDFKESKVILFLFFGGGDFDFFFIS